MNKNLFTSLALCSTLFISCSKGGGGSSTPPVEKKTSEPLEEEFSGTYQAIFSPLNKTVSGHLDGTLSLVRENDSFLAYIRFANGPASSMHIQNVHLGDRCPDESDDLNGDGFVDAEEASHVHKEILIPLDDDLNSQWMGLGTFPASDSFGNYQWSRSADYKKLMKDLYEEDINHTDDYVKLSTNKALSMTSKIVIIRGVHPSTPLPETVSGRGRWSAHQGLPVACGVIRKLGATPGIVDNDETGIAVPEGETIGGSGGADDGAFFPSTNTGTGTSGNYGDDDDEEEEVITTSNTVETE